MFLQAEQIEPVSFPTLQPFRHIISCLKNNWIRLIEENRRPDILALTQQKENLLTTRAQRVIHAKGEHPSRNNPVSGKGHRLDLTKSFFQSHKSLLQRYSGRLRRLNKHRS